jgi:hypothetical protein
LVIVKIEFSAPMAIECLVRNIVTADIDIVAEAHFGAGRRRKQTNSDDAG